MEAAFQSLFELLLYASTMVFFRPEQFKYPTFISLGFTFACNVCYTIYVKQRRGHILHPEKLCACVKRGGHSNGYQAVPRVNSM